MQADPAERSVVRLERAGSVLLLIMTDPPVNALSVQLRRGLERGLQAAAAPDVTAVLICSDLAQFSAGLDPDPVDRASSPNLSDLCLQIEGFAKPVVAALDGSCLGGGLELALACHGRVASETARLGFPEVGFGVVPRAGGTQRLPHLVGAEASLRLLIEPGPVTAAQALAIGLVDRVVGADLRLAGVGMAEAMVGHSPVKTSERRDGMRDPKAYQAALVAARARHPVGHLPAARRAIDCVEAAQLLPLAQGLAFEALAHDELAATPEALGLRHALLAEQVAARRPGSLAGRALPFLGSLALWGGGPAMADLAVQGLAAGLRVTVIEANRELLTETLERIAARQEQAVRDNRSTEATRDADWARLRTGQTADALAEADLILAVDSSSLPDSVVAPVLLLGALPARAEPGKVALHAATAPGLPAELSCAGEVGTDHLALALALARRLGWRLVFTGPGGPIERRLRAALSAAIAQLDSAGISRETIAAALVSYGIGAGNRTSLPPAPEKAGQVLDGCLAALAAQGLRLLGEGVALRASDIDVIAVQSGLFPRWQGGPMHWADQRGLMVLRADLRHRAETAPQIFTPHPLLDRLISEGRGLKSVSVG